jgi:RecB family exonuclease
MSELVDDAGRPVVPVANPRRWWGAPDDADGFDVPERTDGRLAGASKVEGPEPAAPLGVSALRADPASQTGEPVKLSGSQLDGLLACPRQWFLARRARAERDRSPGAVFGTLIHALAQRMAAGDLDRAEALRRLDEVWADLEFPALWLRASERDQAVAALGRIEEWQQTRTGRTVVGLELRHESVIEAGPHVVRLTGQIDRLDRDGEGRLWVVDFKTAKVAPSLAEAAGNHQMGVYQLAIHSGALESLVGEGPRLGGAELVYVRLPAAAGAASPKVFIQASLDTQPHLDEDNADAIDGLTMESMGEPSDYPTWVHHRLAVAAQVVVEDAYPAVAGRSCRWCQFRSSCPEQVGDEETRP